MTLGAGPAGTDTVGMTPGAGQVGADPVGTDTAGTDTAGTTLGTGPVGTIPGTDTVGIIPGTDPIPVTGPVTTLYTARDTTPDIQDTPEAADLHTIM